MQKRKMTQIVRVGIVSLCIYAGIGMINDQPVKLEMDYVPITEESIHEMLEVVEENTPIEVEDNNKNMTIFYYVVKNENLDQDEKELVYELSTLLKETPYLNTFISGTSLEKLNIVYGAKKENVKTTTVATYSSDTKEITVYAQKDEVPREILLHEIIHCIFNNIRTFSLPDYFVEGTTELLTNEYFAKNPYVEETTYPFETTMVRLLCEMAGPSNVLHTYTDGNMHHIEESLEKVMTKEETKEFLKKTESIFKTFRETGKVGDELQEVLSYVDQFFQKKQNKNQLSNSYLYDRNILKIMATDNAYEHYLTYIYEEEPIRKAYFSKSLIEKEQLHSKNKKKIKQTDL